MDFERSIVDKFWTDVPGITQEIRKAGVEQQVIVKTPVEEEAPQGPLFCGEGRVHIRKKAHRGQRCIYGGGKGDKFHQNHCKQAGNGVYWGREKALLWEASGWRPDIFGPMMQENVWK